MYISYTTTDVSSSLLRVSKLFHAEASHILYSENTFRTVGIYGITFKRRFLDTIGPNNAASIIRLRLCWNIVHDSFLSTWEDVNKWCHCLPGLRELWFYDIFHNLGDLLTSRQFDGRDAWFPESYPPEFWSLLRKIKSGLETETKLTWKLLRSLEDEYVVLVAQQDEVKQGLTDGHIRESASIKPFLQLEDISLILAEQILEEVAD